ncbi:MAG: cysteine synthase family protein [Candidatus Eisenbacteria bacterium]
MSMAADMGAGEDLVARIGNTPLLRLDAVAQQAGGLPDGVEVHAKAEHLNPGGSVKDRAARAMILDGERSGRLAAGKAILDATSGNTGIAYAMIGAARGWPVTVCLPRNASAERKEILRAWGAVVVETDPLEGTDGAQELARAMALEEPARWFYPNQYDNPANWRAHLETTAPEIWRQTAGRVTHFVAGLGTTGTFVGTTRGLRRARPNLRAIALQPDVPLHGIEGLKHLPTARVPGIYDVTVADAHATVSTADALAMTRALWREEKLDVGVSSGANVHAALELARRLPAGSLVVTILCDRGDRYPGEAR